jgi:hypothetical protein
MGGIITFSVWQAVQFLCLAILAFAAWKIYCRLDDRMEKLREECIDVSVELEKEGLRRLPRILRYFAVGNYSAIWGEIKSFAREIKEGPAAVAKEFESVFRNMLTYHLSTTDGMTLVKAQIAAVEAGATGAGK